MTRNLNGLLYVGIIFGILIFTSTIVSCSTYNSTLRAEEIQSKQNAYLNTMDLQVDESTSNAITAAYPGTVNVSNDYLEISVKEDNGRFTLGNKLGDPANLNDDNKILLYGHPGPRTSFTSVRIDGNNYVYGEGGSFSEIPTAYGTYVKGVWERNDIQVTQVCGLVSNPSTGRADVMQIRYQLTNLDPNNSHAVGLRILLDTMLGLNDGAPFQVPGSDPITTECEFLKSRDEIPDFWQSFDYLENPTVISQGTLKGSGATEPDRIVFASWPSFKGTVWDYVITPGKRFGTSTSPDSSVGLYWNEVSLEPNETIEYVTYYGLSDLSQSFGDISLSVTSPIQLEVIDGQYSPNPFIINAYIEHDLTNAIDVQLDIDLPEGLELILGSYETQTITVDSDGGSVAWFVRASEQAESQLLTYTVTASADGMSDQSVSRGVNVPRISLDYDTGFRLDSHGYNFSNTGRDGFSWDQFRNLYGEDEVEIAGQRSERAKTFFKESYTHSGKGGRCFGMAASSLYLYQNDLNGSDTGRWLDDLPQWNIFPDFVNTNQDWIEYYQPRQMDEACQNERNTYNNAEVVYNEMKQRMASGNWEDDPMVLDIWWHKYEYFVNRVNQGHTVTPTRIVEAPDHSTASVFVYDNAIGNAFEWEFVFNLSTWEVRDATPFWNQGNAFDSVSAVSLNAIQQEPQMRNYEFITSQTGHLLYTDNSGNVLGYYNGEFVDGIQGAYKVEITGDEGDFPETYYTGDLDLKQQIIGVEDGTASVSIMKPNGLVVVETEVMDGSQDELKTSADASSIEFVSSGDKSFINILLDRETDDMARTVHVNGLDVYEGNSIKVSISETLDTVGIQNIGDGRTYTVFMEQIGVDSSNFTVPIVMSVDSDSTVYLTPNDWNDLENTEIEVSTDLGNDGTIDYVETTGPNQAEAPPQADFTAIPLSGNSPLTITFTDTSTGNITSWLWDFGDGQTSDEQHPVHVYTNPGSYTVKLLVANTAGNSTQIKPDFVVVSSSLTSLQADFTAIPLSGNSPLTITFNDISIGDITSWLWDFGDGQTSEEQHPVHVYTNPGSYTVKLVAANTASNSTQIKPDYITVSSPSVSPDEGGGSGGGSTTTKSSSGGGGGGGGNTGEKLENIVYKDVKSADVIKDKLVSYTFNDDRNVIDYITFTAMKNWGKISTTVEVLNDTSGLVKTTPPDTVYCNVNLWVGKAGFATPENIKDAAVGFKVEKDWINENGIVESSICLCRYDGSEWQKLETKKRSEGDTYLHFEASTPGFSPFAITAEKQLSSPVTDDTDTELHDTESDDLGIEEAQSERSNIWTLAIGILLIGMVTVGYMYLKRDDN